MVRVCVILACLISMPMNLFSNELYSKYMSETKRKPDPVKHYFFNALYANMSGAFFGVLIGLSFYRDDTIKDNKEDFKEFLKVEMPIYASSIGIAGAFTGLGLAWFEIKDKAWGVYSKPLLNATWYGILAGTGLGALVGLIPYSSSEKISDLYNFTGYGATAGLVSGIFVYLLNLPEKPDLNVTMTFDGSSLAANYYF